MVSPVTRKLGQEYGLQWTDGTMSGITGGFGMRIADGAGSKLIQLALGARKDGELADKQRVEAALTQPLKKYAIVNLLVEPIGNGVSAVFSFYDQIGTPKRMRAFLDAELPALKQAGFLGAEICPECEQPLSPGQASFFSVGDGTALVHDHCAQALDAETKQLIDEYVAEQKQSNAESGSTILGFIGAALGGIVGMIPAILALYLGWFLSILSGLIGICADFGYGLFRGKPGRRRLVVVVVVTLLLIPASVILGDYMGFAADVLDGKAVSDLGYVFQPADLPNVLWGVLQMPSYWKDMLPNLGMGYLFGLLGLWGASARLKRSVPQGAPKTSISKLAV